MGLAPGTKLGPYEILAPLGAGGMGEVYRARDTNLDRDVAIKVLPAAVAQNPERLARFEREAKVLAALNHPNIAQIYGVEQGALVMELVEGETLAGPLPVATAIDYARQIADGMEVAHEKGIVHRDLKPANIKVTPQGVIKILDFGLAAVTQSTASRSDASISPTLTLAATQMGVLMGTAGYMSPEQAAGKPVDKRADIWSFGVVVWEMLTGKRLFDGETVSHTLAAVLTKDLDWKQLPADVPAGVRRLLKRCLDRDLRRRLPDIGAARLELEDAMAGGGGTEVPPQAQSLPHKRLPWVVAGVGILAALALGLVHFREAAPQPAVMRASLLPPDKMQFEAAGNRAALALSPDGRRLVFAATSSDGKTQLWIRPLSALSAQPLLGTEGGTFPFWSPDGGFVAFFAGGKLKKIDISGGPPVTLADAPTPRGGSWSLDGTIVFAPDSRGGLLRISAAGGATSPATTVDSAKGVNHRFPWFLPDARHFLYAAERRGSGAGRNTRLFLHLASLDSKEDRVLGDADSNAVYAEGHLLFLRENTLMAEPFDEKRLAVSGEAVPIAERVRSVLTPGTIGLFSVSATGTLVYETGTEARGSRQLTWFDRQGKVLGTAGEPGQYTSPALSPDGTQVAFNRFDGGNQDIWLHEFARGTTTRFTFDPSPDSAPVWSPDGRFIIFASERDGSRNLYRKISSGAGNEEVLLKSNRSKTPTDWSRDGRFLLYHLVDAKTGQDIAVLPLTPDRTGAQGANGEAKPMVYVNTEFNELDGRFSPDARFVAYTSNASGMYEVYVQPYPMALGGKWMVSKGGGSRPHWRRDGKELFYLSRDGMVMSVEVTTSPTFQAGNAKPLFRAAPVDLDFDVSADGQKFIRPVDPQAAAGDSAAAPEPLTVVLNWQAELKKR